MMDYTVTLTAKDLEFRERARAAGIPSMLVSMYAGALQKLVEDERDRYAEKFAELIAPKICELLTEHRQFKAAVIVGQYFRGEK